MEINNNEDLIDIRDIIKRYKELKEEFLVVDENFDEEDDNYLYDNEKFDEENLEEFNSLKKLLNECEGNGGDHEWNGDWYPVTLINDDHFEDFAEQECKELGYLNQDHPWWIEINWEATAGNMKQNYTSVDFDGADYWVKC